MMVFQCEKLAQRTTVKQQWKKCRHLIVDEVFRCFNALSCYLKSKSFVRLPQDLKRKTLDFHGWWGVLQKTWSGGALCQRKWSALWRHPAHTHWRFSSGLDLKDCFVLGNQVHCTMHSWSPFKTCSCLQWPRRPRVDDLLSRPQLGAGATFC